MKHYTVRASVLAIVLAYAASLGAADRKPLREFTATDAARWKQISIAKFTPDGRWLAYCLSPHSGLVSASLQEHIGKGESFLVIQSVDDGRQLRYSAGEASLGACNLKMSPSGRWVAFHVAPTGKEASAAASSALSVAVINIASGERRQFAEVREFNFAGTSNESLVLERNPKPDGRFNLTIEQLDHPGSRSFEGVSAYSIAPNGAKLVWSDAQLRLHDFQTGTTKTLDGKLRQPYRHFTWSKQGNTLAAVRGLGADGALMIFGGLNDAEIHKTVLEISSWAGFPQGYSLSEPLQWRDDAQGLFFSISRPVSAPQHTSTTPRLVLWHSRDDEYPGEKKARAESLSSYWSYVSLRDRHFIQLGDETLRSLEPHSRGQYALGYDIRPYGRLNQRLERYNRSQTRDYYLIDLNTGRRDLLIKGLNVAQRGNGMFAAQPQLSPDGNTFVYQDNEGDYIAQSISTGTRRNLTAGLPTKFYFEENSPKSLRQPREPLRGAYFGWTTDEASILISDYYDIWALPLHGGSALNLTGNGKRDNWIYALHPMDGRYSSIGPTDLRKPVYFKVYDKNTGRNGLARRDPQTSSSQILRWDEPGDSVYFSIENTSKHFMRYTSHAEHLNYYSLDSKWRPAKQLTDANPQQREFLWTPGSKYLTFNTTRGDTRHAALLLPAGYEHGRTYPTVTIIYLNQTSHFNNYTSLIFYPWLQRGYAVLLPEIVPRINEAGHAALESVVAAVDAAAATGIVDRDRVGLFGHSYGGYETYFIVSQTNLFKAAIPNAGMTDLISSYSDLYEIGPNSFQSEAGQPFLAGPWWEHWNAFIDNSPLYFAKNIRTPLLIQHGNRDNAVAFSQAVKMFNTLFRLENKQVVLLEYVGEDHGFSVAAEADMDQRSLQFFDHFLKGEPAPKWWSEGISYHENTVPAP